MQPSTWSKIGLVLGWAGIMLALWSIRTTIADTSSIPVCELAAQECSRCSTTCTPDSAALQD